MECHPFANFLQILINIHKLVPKCFFFFCIWPSWWCHAMPLVRLYRKMYVLTVKRWHGFQHVMLYKNIQFCFELRWSEVRYGEVLRVKSTVYIRVTLYWGYWIVLWLFHLVCTLYCGCFDFFNCVCFDNMCTCVYCVFFVLLCFVLSRLCIFIPICFAVIVLSLLPTSEKSINNINNNKFIPNSI